MLLTDPSCEIFTLRCGNSTHVKWRVQLKSTPTLLRNNYTEKDIKFFFNELRKASIIWSGRNEALKRSSKKVFVRRSKMGKKIYKTHWQCAKCSKWYRNVGDVQVDHIVEIGGVTEFFNKMKQDWNKVFAAMFPRPVWKHLQVLCCICHQKKTKAFMSASLRYERKRRDG